MFQLAVHEFGHSLGLDHIDIQTSVMYPSYQGYQENFKLDPFDVKAIKVFIFIFHVFEKLQLQKFNFENFSLGKFHPCITCRKFYPSIQGVSKGRTPSSTAQTKIEKDKEKTNLELVFI